MRNRKHFASFPDKFSDTYDSHTSENNKIPGLPGATQNSEKKVKTTSQKLKIKLPSDLHTYQQQTGMMHRSIELEKNRQESISSRCEIDNIYFPKSSPNSLNCWSKIFSKKKNDNCLNDSMEIDSCKSVYSDITPTLVEYGLSSIYKLAEQDRIDDPIFLDYSISREEKIRRKKKNIGISFLSNRKQKNEELKNKSYTDPFLCNFNERNVKGQDIFSHLDHYSSLSNESTNLGIEPPMSPDYVRNTQSKKKHDFVPIGGPLSIFNETKKMKNKVASRHNRKPVTERIDFSNNHSLNTVARGVSKVIDGTLADSFGHTIYPATSEESHRTFFNTSSDDDTTCSSSCSSQDVI